MNSCNHGSTFDVESLLIATDSSESASFSADPFAINEHEFFTILGELSGKLNN
jgi:hypothetical protein